MEPVPSIEVTHRMPNLSVHQHPFIAIGVEVDFRNSIVPDRLELLYPHAAAMGCNTLFVPVLWSQVEQVPGRFNFGFVDRQLELAARHGLKLGLLWFGSNRGGSLCFPNLPGTDGKPAGDTVQVPPDVFADRAKYRRACRADGRPADSLCPTCEATLDRERIAFRSFLRHLALADTDRTVVLIQVENEVSTPETGRLRFADRCFCPVCTDRHARSGQTDRTFGDRSYGDFVAALVEAGAEEYPVPCYVNFVSTPRPGENIAYYLECAPRLASCAPDIYAGDTASFRRILRSFAVGRNVPLVAETSSDTKDPSDRTVWYAVCEGGAVGFVLWAVDCAYGLGAWEDGYAHRTPLVGPDGAWSAQGFRIRDEFGVLGLVMGPLCRHRGTDRLQWFVAEGAPLSRPMTIPGVHGTIEVAADGRGLAVLTGPDDVTLAGHGFEVRLDGFAPSAAASGRWSGRAFVPDAGPVKLAAEGTSVRISLETPGIVRVSPARG
jgi:hypothetical protein